MMERTFSEKVFLLMGLLAPQLLSAAEFEQPHVILIMTDDQGIGGLGCMGNPYVQTPHIDAFHDQCVRLTNFHASPLSTPTRGALMTGRYPIHNGAWATFKGRDIVSRRTPALAEIFTDNGYQTALFGKWHLGDNYPCRPTDCGFSYVVQHKSGGVGELSDYWGNNFFDDTYFVNNEPVRFEGYCTDVWFSQAMAYMKAHKDDREPMFIYLSTNAPHGPHYVDKKYSAPYEYLREKGQTLPEFYGQITNIDENFGRLLAFLEEEGLRENSILIFMTDNGAGGRNNLCTDGYRGAKTSNLEGGHRVFFMMDWPAGHLTEEQDINDLTCHVDLLPTLAGLCQLQLRPGMELDGVDFSGLLKGNGRLDDRVMFLHNRQDSRPPMDVQGACILKDEWRLIDGKQLYDVARDRKQQKNVIAVHRAFADSLLALNGAFIADCKQQPEYRDFIPVVVGNPAQRVAVLTIQHAIGEDQGIWKSEQVAQGMKNKNDEYAVYFEKEGRYRISLSRWPRECQGTIWGIPDRNPKDWFHYLPVHPETARLVLDGQEQVLSITEDMKEAEFIVEAKKGRATLKADFIEGGVAFGAYYIYLEFLA